MGATATFLQQTCLRKRLAPHHSQLLDPELPQQTLLAARHFPAAVAIPGGSPLLQTPMAARLSQGAGESILISSHVRPSNLLLLFLAPRLCCRARPAAAARLPQSVANRFAAPCTALPRCASITGHQPVLLVLQSHVHLRRLQRPAAFCLRLRPQPGAQVNPLCSLARVHVVAEDACRFAARRARLGIVQATAGRRAVVTTMQVVVALPILF